MKNEDQNFSLFNYVNEQQNEVEKLEEQLHELEEEEQKFAQVWVGTGVGFCTPRTNPVSLMFSLKMRVLR